MWQRVHILCTHRAYKNWSEKKTKKPSIGINDKRLKSKCNIIKFQTSLINKMSFKLKKSGLNISNNIKSQNLSSLTRDQTAALAVKVQNPSNWNARNSHISILKCKKKSGTSIPAIWKNKQLMYTPFWMNPQRIILCE